MQGDLSLEHYDDSQHSRASLGGLGSRGIGGSRLSGGGGILSRTSSGLFRDTLSRESSGGFARDNFGLSGTSIGAGAPWGSGMGGQGQSDAGGAAGGQHFVVPGGIWLPTPRTQGTNSFSPSSSTGGGGGGGRAGGGSGPIRKGTGDAGDLGEHAGSEGFFGGSNEPRCARCRNMDAVGQSQVRKCLFSAPRGGGCAGKSCHAHDWAWGGLKKQKDGIFFSFYCNCFTWQQRVGFRRCESCLFA